MITKHHFFSQAWNQPNFSPGLRRGTLFFCAKSSCAEGGVASFPPSCVHLLLRLLSSGMPAMGTCCRDAVEIGGGEAKKRSAATEAPTLVYLDWPPLTTVRRFLTSLS